LKIARWLGLGMGLALLGATSVAAAQERREFTPESQESRIGLEFDWLHTEPPGPFDPINTFTWDLFAQIRVSRRLFLDFDIPWALVSLPPLRERGVFGNPVLGLHYAADISAHWSWFIGGALTIPVNADPDNPVYASSAAGIRAYSGLYRFAPGLFPLIFRVGLEVSSAPFFARFDLVPTTYIGINNGNRSLLMVDQGNELGLRARKGFLGGLRLQANFVLTDTNDHAQFAMEPFLGYEANGPGLFVRFGVLFALDQNAGFGFDHGKDAIARFSIGGKF
jgi:hypothetical protein